MLDGTLDLKSISISSSSSSDDDDEEEEEEAEDNGKDDNESRGRNVEVSSGAQPSSQIFVSSSSIISLSSWLLLLEFVTVSSIELEEEYDIMLWWMLFILLSSLLWEIKEVN